MSNDWGFGGEPEKKKGNVQGAGANFAIFLVGVVFVLAYGLYKVVNPTAALFEDGLNIAAHVSLVLGGVAITVAILRIRALNRKRTRGF